MTENTKPTFANWKIALAVTGALALAGVAISAVVSEGKCSFVFGDGGVSLNCKDSGKTATKPDP